MTYVHFTIGRIVIAVPARLAPDAIEFSTMCSYENSDVVRMLIQIPGSFVVR